jgi:hypothetical protein
MMCKIVINSNARFSSVTLPPLLKSLKSAGFRKSEILIMIGGYTSRRESITRPKRFKLPFDAIDFTSFIELSERDIQSDYCFVMHDTSKVGKNFKEIISSVEPRDLDAIPLRKLPSMNIGLYRTAFIRQKCSDLTKLKNSDYTEEGMHAMKVWGVENEDFLSWGQDDLSITSYADLLSDPRDGVPIVMGEYDYYTNNVKRRIEYYEYLDFYKVKANWSRKEKYELGL